MTQTEQDSGKTYADIWGEAVHSNRHLRVLSMGLAGLVLLLVVIIIRLSSVELPKPIVVRVDEVGRAEALAYETVEAQADPLDPTTKYFLNRFIDDYYSPLRLPGDRGARGIYTGKDDYHATMTRQAGTVGTGLVRTAGVRAAPPRR